MLYLFYGDDTFRAKERIDQLRRKFVELYDPSGHNIEVLHAGEFTLESFFTKAKAQGFLGHKKLLVIKNLFTHKKLRELQDDILRFLKKQKNSKDENYLIFWQEGAPRRNNALFAYLKQTCDKRCVEEYARMNARQLVAWAKEQAQKLGKTLETGGAELLIASAGADTWFLHHEIAKLCHAAPDQTIGAERVSELLSAQQDVDMFRLLDSLSARNRAETHALMELYLRTATDLPFLINMIIRQFRLIAQAKAVARSARNVYAVSEQLGVPHFVARKLMQHERNFSERDLARIYDRLVALDMLLKSEPGRVRTALSMLVDAL